MSPDDVLGFASLFAAGGQTPGLSRRWGSGHLQQPAVEHRTLEFDPRVNYPLDRREVSYHRADRAQTTRSLWNTYFAHFLPFPSSLLVRAPPAERGRAPADCDWLYVVKIDAQGTTLFTRD